MLNIMLLVGKAFREPGESITTAQIARCLCIPSMALAPLGTALEDAGLLITSEKEELLPGREMSRITLEEILGVVREQGDTGSFSGPTWTDKIESLGSQMDAAVAGVVGDRSLSDLLDEYGAESAPAT